MVDELAAWYEQHAEDLKARGINARLQRSPEDGRSKAAAWINLSQGGTEGEIIVWDSGECELWGPVREEEAPGTDPRAEHRQLDTGSDLAAALARLVSLFD